MKENEGHLVSLGQTEEDWYSDKAMNETEYLKTRAIRVDTKTLRQNYSAADYAVFAELADLIERM